MAPDIRNQNSGPVYLPHSGTMWPPRRIKPTSCDFDGKFCGKARQSLRCHIDTEMALMNGQETLRQMIMDTVAMFSDIVSKSGTKPVQLAMDTTHCFPPTNNSEKGRMS